jgi:hypothetical protein
VTKTGPKFAGFSTVYVVHFGGLLRFTVSTNFAVILVECLTFSLLWISIKKFVSKLMPSPLSDVYCCVFCPFVRGLWISIYILLCSVENGDLKQFPLIETKVRVIFVIAKYIICALRRAASVERARARISQYHGPCTDWPPPLGFDVSCRASCGRKRAAAGKFSSGNVDIASNQTQREKSSGSAAFDAGETRFTLRPS